MVNSLEIEIPISINVPRRQKDGSYKIVIEGNPVAKARARQTFKGGQVRSYNTPRTEAAEEFLREIFLEYRDKCCEFTKVGIAGKVHGHEYKQYVPLKITLYCYFIRKEWIPESIVIPALKKLGDVDNLLKTVMDSMTNVIIAEDCQITTALIKKRWSEKDFGYLTIKLEEDKL